MIVVDGRTVNFGGKEKFDVRDYERMFSDYLRTDNKEKDRAEYDYGALSDYEKDIVDDCLWFAAQTYRSAISSDLTKRYDYEEDQAYKDFIDRAFWFFCGDLEKVRLLEASEKEGRNG